MPDWKPQIRERLASLKSDGAWQAEVVEEIEEHLQDRYRELRRAGNSDEDAARLTLEELREGGELAEELRRTGRPPARPKLDWGKPTRGAARHAILPDLRLAFRSIAQRPAFSLLVIAMLTLGIGGNAAIFSIYNGLFLRPLPFSEPDRLVDLDEAAPNWNLKFVGVSNPDFYAWRERNQSFERMAFFTGASFNITGAGLADRVRGATVTHDLLDVLKLKPALGRNFTPDEDRKGGAKVVMIGQDLWDRLFQRDPNVLGKIVQLHGEPYTIIGVLPREALFPDQAELWTPLQADPKDGDGWYLNGVGRLKPGVTVEQAYADLLRVHKGMEAQVNKITFPKVMPLRDRYLGDFRPVARVLLGGVGVVLLIACVNIAALMMVRAAARSREMAIRTAIGAGRGRIIQQLLTEHGVLALIGGLAGVALGAALLKGMLALFPQGIPRWVSFSMDARFAIFSMAITGAAAILFGLTPAIQASGVDARGCMQEAGPRTSLSRGRRRWMNVLVVSEIALAMILMVGSGLLLRAWHKVSNVDPGFRPENVLTFSVNLPAAKYPKNEQHYQLYENVLDRLKALPGVQTAGAATAPPLGGHWGMFFDAEGVKFAEGEKNPVVLMVVASPDYFQAIGISLLEGRTFRPADSAPNAEMVGMVNQTFAKRYWPGQSAVGKRVRGGGSGERWINVIGVVKDEKHYGLDQEVRPQFFAPFRFIRRESMTFVVRTTVDPASITSAAREALRQIDPDLPMFGVRTMQEQLDRSLSTRRAYSLLFGVFAGVALLLAAAGIYGVISYAVSQRTQEIGVRMALGANPAQMLGEVLRGGMLLVAIGLVIGGAAAMAVAGAGLLDSVLFGVSPRDQLVYVAVAVGIVLVGLLANLAPARRASSIDPIRALRFE